VAILPDVRLASARVRRTGLAVVVSVALFTWSNDAYAKEKPPKHPGASSVDQYRESIPTASGPSYAESETSTTSAHPLAPAVVVRLTHVAPHQAARLEQAATSPQYGAPQRRLPRLRERTPVRAPATATAARALPQALAASAGSSRVLLLAAALAGLTGALVFAARRS
jgi:hypothetical protein